MTGKKSKQAVVIGSGVGGSAIAALLAENGFQVTVLERNSFSGGKTASYERDGFTCDMGVHVTARGENGPIGEVARHVNADLEFIKVDPFLRLITGNRSYDMPLQFSGLRSLFNLARLAGVKIRNYTGALRLFRKIMSISEEKDLEPYYGLPFRDFVLSYTDDRDLLTILDIISGLMFVIPSSVASTAEFVWSFSTWAKEASSGYPKGGFRQISRSFLDACIKKGGSIHFNEKVERIRIDNNRVSGVETATHFYPADIVISNAGIRKTVEIAGVRHFDPSYVTRVLNLKDSAGAVSIKYALDYRPVDVPIVVHFEKGWDFTAYLDQMEMGEVPENPPLYIPCPTIPDPGLAPDGRHLLLVGTIAPAGLSHSATADKLLDAVDRTMQTIFPDLSRHIIWKHRTGLEYIDKMGGRGAGEVIGLAQRFDQDGVNKPDPKMPVNGLYLVGCDAGGLGIGTENAADSALKVADRIIQELDSLDDHVEGHS